MLGAEGNQGGKMVRRRGKADNPEPFSATWAWILDNPIAARHARRVIRLLDIRPGMRVLDVGCGTGRLTLPLAELTGPSGEVVGLDVQSRMLEMLKRRAARRGLANVKTIHASAGRANLDPSSFDRALVVSVLGEIPARERDAAVEEIAAALEPGGLVAIAEGRPDPHRLSKEAVTALAREAGLRPVRVDPVWLGFVLQASR
jgi:ubiquinone/menaquinone biosynthesis C-methylase UbiE